MLPNGLREGLLAVWLLRNLAAGCACALLLAGYMSPRAVADTASVPGWRVVKTIGPSGGVPVITSGLGPEFVAAGAGDAWSDWTICELPCTGPSLVYRSVLEHWGGARWRPVALPKRFASYRQSAAIGASSASLWLFNGSTNVLRWNGSAWKIKRIPQWVVPSQFITYWVPLVFSSTSAWVFNLCGGPGCDHYAARWNGRHWSKSILPALPVEVSALAPEDIWVLGASFKKARYSLMHWNGRRWDAVALPKAARPGSSTQFVAGLTALSSKDVWLTWDIQDGQSAATTAYLLHWNGTTWKRVRAGSRASMVGWMTGDGHGGLWLAVNVPARNRWYLYHRAGGRWSKYPLPGTSTATPLDIRGITSIPGTSSVWVYGDLVTNRQRNVLGAIWKYGY